MPFSRRTGWSRSPNALAEARARASVRLDLRASNPTALGLEYDEAALVEALTGPELFRYAPSPLGAPEAREAVAAYYARRGVAVSPAQVVLTASTSEAYAHAFRLLADPRAVVAAPTPSYPLFAFLAELADVRLEPYRFHRGAGYALDDIAPDVAAILSVSPSNPTGSCPSAAERAHMIRAAPVISDEVFLDYRDDEDFASHSFAGAAEGLCLTLSGLSKVAGLPQMKVAWIVVSGTPALAAEALARLEIIADTYLSVGPGQRLLPAALDGADAWQARLRGRIRENRARIAGAGIEAWPSEGGWYAMLPLPADADDEAVAIALLERGVEVEPGFLYDAEPCLVVSLIVPPEAMAAGIPELLAATRG